MSKAVQKFVADQIDWMREQSDDIRIFRMPVEPRPASRPRISKWGVYYGKPYMAFRQAGQPYADAYSAHEPITGPVHVLMECVSTKPKTGKLKHPRGDVDNYAKGPLDMMTKSGNFWKDDVQVVSLQCVKRYADLELGETCGVNIFLFPIIEE